MNLLSLFHCGAKIYDVCNTDEERWGCGVSNQSLWVYLCICKIVLSLFHKGNLHVKHFPAKQWGFAEIKMPQEKNYFCKKFPFIFMLDLLQSLSQFLCLPDLLDLPFHIHKILTRNTIAKNNTSEKTKKS